MKALNKSLILMFLIAVSLFVSVTTVRTHAKEAETTILTEALETTAAATEGTIEFNPMIFLAAIILLVIIVVIIVISVVSTTTLPIIEYFE